MGYLFSRVTKVKNCHTAPMVIEATKFPEFVVFSKEVPPNDYVEIVYADLRIEANPYRPVNISIILEGSSTRILPSNVRDSKQLEVKCDEGLISTKLTEGNAIMRIGCIVLLKRYATKLGKEIGKTVKKLINHSKENVDVAACTEIVKEGFESQPGYVARDLRSEYKPLKRNTGSSLEAALEEEIKQQSNLINSHRQEGGGVFAGDMESTR